MQLNAAAVFAADTATRLLNRASEWASLQAARLRGGSASAAPAAAPAMAAAAAQTTVGGGGGGGGGGEAASEAAVDTTPKRPGTVGGGRKAPGAPSAAPRLPPQPSAPSAPSAAARLLAAAGLAPQTPTSADTPADMSADSFVELSYGWMPFVWLASLAHYMENLGAGLCIADFYLVIFF